jgi:hypothetical protein
MGSIEVFDFKNKQWIPYVQDFKKWQRHFEDISQGRVRADHKGRYIVGSGARWRSTTVSSDEPRVTMVTPIAHEILHVWNPLFVFEIENFYRTHIWQK